MKRIYIPDAVHQHLKREAKRQGRTLQWVVEDRLTYPPTILGGIQREEPTFTSIAQGGVRSIKASSSVPTDVFNGEVEFVPEEEV